MSLEKPQYVSDLVVYLLHELGLLWLVPIMLVRAFVSGQHRFLFTVYRNVKDRTANLA